MLYLLVKAAVSGLLIAIISEVSRRQPGWGGLIASLPLVSVLALIWLLRSGMNIWLSLAIACLVTTALYAGFAVIAPKLGIRL
ncbi:MAG TPA: hypothetical protein VFK50_05315 [Sphingomicrobium sp.]|nr:hypothetical protein [Sphingomicrobium sp.]